MVETLSSTTEPTKIIKINNGMSLSRVKELVGEDAFAHHVASLSFEEAQKLLYDWSLWARPDQRTPPGNWWSIWLLLAGRGFGKTRTGAEWIKEREEKGLAKYIALVSQSAGDARDVMVEGEAGILSIYPENEQPLYEPSKRRITWKSGAQATIYTAEDPNQLRGPSHDTAWVDEPAVFRNVEDVWSNLMLGLRLGDSKCIVTTTPRPIPWIRNLVSREGKEEDLERGKNGKDVYVTRGRTRDNFSNLSSAFLNQIITKYEGTRLGRQELDGEILEEVEGALWNRDTLEETRRSVAPLLKRIIVALDPNVTHGENSAECGIIVAGVGAKDNHAYVLEDLSKKVSPAKWAKIAVTAYEDHGADHIIGEKNNGGELIRLTLQSQPNAENYPVKLVWASRGKITRAEPVAALYEQNKVHHVGEPKPFSELEDQMCTYDGESGLDSPDRLDALVWAISELMLDKRTFGLVFGRGRKGKR